MRRFAPMPLLALCLLLTLLCVPAHPQNSAVPSHEPFPGVPAAPYKGAPLSRQPYVYALKRLDPAQMNDRDAAVVSSLNPQLQKKAALASFDLNSPGWSYQQIVCPAFPDFVLLAFRHGPDPDGSSRFVAVLARDAPEVWIVF